MVANEQADARPPAAPAERAALIKAYAQAGYDEDVVEQVGRIVCGALMDRLTSSQVGTLTNVLESFITIGTPAESLLAAIATFNERYTDERERSERFCKWLLHAEEQTVAGRTTNAPAQSPEQQQ